MASRPERARPRAGRIVAIAGGKGGVGKSLVSLNLAVTLGRMGHRVTLVDGDLGAANLHSMLGVTRPGPGLGAFFDHEIENLADAAMATDQPNLRFIPGTSRPGAANINSAQKMRLLRGLSYVGGDVVMIDLGAGTAYNTVDLVAAADIKVLVMTPQLTSLQNAFAFLKACVQRVLRRLPEQAASRDRLDRLLTGEGEVWPIQRVIAELRREDPALADEMVDSLLRFGVILVGNMLVTEQDREVIERMSKMFSDYLLVSAPVSATFKLSDEMRRSIDLRKPAVTGERIRDVANEMRALARAIMDMDVGRLRSEFKSDHKGQERTVPIWIERDAV